GVVFEAGSVRLRYGLVDCSPPGRTDLGSPPAAETFTPELSPNESPPPGVRYDCGADWAICAGGTRTHWNVGLLGRTRFHYRGSSGGLPGPDFHRLVIQPLLGGTGVFLLVAVRCNVRDRRTASPVRDSEGHDRGIGFRVAAVVQPWFPSLDSHEGVS